MMLYEIAAHWPDDQRTQIVSARPHRRGQVPSELETWALGPFADQFMPLPDHVTISQYEPATIGPLCTSAVAVELGSYQVTA